MDVDKLTVSLIRALNRDPWVQRMSDVELIQTFGAAAQLLADGIREAIREELLRLHP